MIRLDFHSPANNEKIGYGRAYLDIRSELEKMSPSDNGFRLTEAHAGGDVQIYFGSMWKKFSEYFERKADRFYIYTMFESTEIPKEWLDMVRLFDGIIVPSEWNAEVFRKVGIAKPIHVIPLGIKTEDWPIQERDYSGCFNIIWQGTGYGDRKAGDFDIDMDDPAKVIFSMTVVKLFMKMKLPNSRLTLKLNPHYFKSRTEFDLPLSIDPPIRSIGMKYSQEQMLSLLKGMHLSVYPSTGEGFGLIPLEHMTTGLSVILSNNTAMSQFCDRQFNMPVQCEEICSRFAIGSGYLPNEDEIESYIRWAYENRRDLNALGLSGAEWVRKNWTVRRTAERLSAFAKKEVANVARVG